MVILTAGKVQALIPQRLISDVQAAPEVSLHHDQPLPASRVRMSQVLPGDSPYPEFAVPVEGSQQFDDVGVVAGGQDLDLHHVILQLILALGLDDLGSCQSARFLVLGLQDKTREFESRESEERQEHKIPAAPIPARLHWPQP